MCLVVSCVHRFIGGVREEETIFLVIVAAYCYYFLVYSQINKSSQVVVVRLILTYSTQTFKSTSLFFLRLNLLIFFCFCSMFMCSIV